jgi:hypothetical protein
MSCTPDATLRSARRPALVVVATQRHLVERIQLGAVKG